MSARRPSLTGIKGRVVPGALATRRVGTTVVYDTGLRSGGYTITVRPFLSAELRRQAMAIHNDGDTCHSDGDTCVGDPCIDALDDRRVAVEVANVDEENVGLEISTANRSELLIVPRADATVLAARILQAAHGVEYPPL